VTGIALFLRISAWLPLLAGVSLAAGPVVPPGVFSVNHITIGMTTLDEVQKIYGTVEPSRVGPGDSADIAICYRAPSSTGRVFIIFESGDMGAFKEITGFRLSAERGSERCVSTAMDGGALATKNGIRLGQSLDAFQKAIPVSFKRRGPILEYEGVSRRAATADELKRLRAAWPNQKRYHVDVTIDIRAAFRAKRLVDFYVHKVESY